SRRGVPERLCDATNLDHQYAQQPIPGDLGIGPEISKRSVGAVYALYSLHNWPKFDGSADGPTGRAGESQVYRRAANSESLRAASFGNDVFYSSGGGSLGKSVGMIKQFG